jgi:hypothetical protein
VNEEEFKKIRHRFYRLGNQRRHQVLVALGLIEDSEKTGKEQEKALLFLCLEDAEKLARLLTLIDLQEKLGLAEKALKEDASYYSGGAAE